MSDLEKAARMALEAISGSGDFLFNFHDCEPNNEREMQAYQAALAANETAFNALRQALEQPAQQHVSVMTVLHLKDRTEIGYGPASAGYDLPTGEYRLYTSPQRKPWVVLTDDDIHALMNEFFYKGMQPSGAHFANFARAIEAKLREKNA